LPKAAAVSARLSALRCVPLAGPSLPVKKVETLEARESNPGYGQRLETIKIRNILPRVSGIKMDGSVGSPRKKQTGRRRKDSPTITKRFPGQKRLGKERSMQLRRSASH
jgi:hypothetical protein